MKRFLDAQERYRGEMDPALEELIEETIREAALPNAMAMAAVIVGAFIVNLALLMLVTGG